MKALRLCMALFFTGLLIGCSSSSGGGGSTTSSSSSSSGGTSSSSSSSGGTPFAGLPLNVDFNLARNEFFGGRYNQSSDVEYLPVGDYLAVSDNADNPFYKDHNSGTRIRMHNTQGIRFGNAGWSAGDQRGNPARAMTNNDGTTLPVLPDGVVTSAGVLPHGDIDLSLPYSITMEITDVQAAGFLRVWVDNNSDQTSGNSVHPDDASLLVNLPAADLGTGGTLVINVPGEVTLEGNPVTSDQVRATQHVGTSTSFLTFRCANGCTAVEAIGNGETDETAPAAVTSIEFSSVVVDYQEDAELQPPLAPAAPSVVATDEIEVDWLIVGNADAYDVGWSTTDDSTTIDLENDVLEDIADTTTTITGLTSGTYYVFVRATNDGGAGPWSASAEATLVTDPPAAAPTGIVATPGVESIQVSWDAVGGATAYDVGWSETDDSSTIDANIQVGITDLSTAIIDLTGGTDYFVFVRGTNAIGPGPYNAPGVEATPEEAGPDADRTWIGNPDMAEATYASILVTAVPAGTNNEVAAGTDETVNGLNFFATEAGPLRHRSTADEFNSNGSGYADGDSGVTPAVGAEAPALRAYIGVPVVPAEAVTITVNSRNSSGSATGLLVFIGGTSGNVLCAVDASPNTASDKACFLDDTHSEDEVRIIYSREDSGGGGQHWTSISRIYGDPSAPILTEDFAATAGPGSGAGASNFFTVGYRAQVNDPTMRMYFPEGGTSGIIFDGSSVNLGATGGGRFTIGQKLIPTTLADPGNTDATGHNVDVGPLAGDLDLSQPWRIRFNIANANAGRFTIYVDNNTTSQGASIHGNDSQVFNESDLATNPIADGPFQVESSEGSEGSFIQLRCDSACVNLTISDLVIEYQ